MNRCRICGRDLKKEEAQFGDDCQRTFNDALQIIETTPEEVGALFLTGDSTVQRWLQKMTAALICSIKAPAGRMAAYDRRNARYFLDAARGEAQNVTDEAVALLAATTEAGRSMTPPGFDEDRYFGSDEDAARKELSAEDRKALAEFDTICRDIARNQAPLDGCEDPAMVEILACLDELNEAA